jgi:hypothetical protein
MHTTLIIVGVALLAVAVLGLTGNWCLVRIGGGPFAWRIARGIPGVLNNTYLVVRPHPVVFIVAGILGFVLMTSPWVAQ